MTTIGMTRPAAFIVAALALAVSGCGSSSNSKSGTSAASASPATTSTSSGGYSSGTSQSSASSSAPTVNVSAKSSKLGMILAAGPKRKTVYLFEADRAGSSACSAACVAVWPPVTGTPRASAGAMSGDLGTITRSDGSKQVTYKGHPLYYYARDGDAGDSYGQGIKAFGSSWYVLAPSGKKVDNT
jgi:predicted lipoprotein with Yx(FWY)xxD motif